jgi:glyoxylase I family protein
VADTLIKGIHHASLLVEDLPRALGFYRDLLGLAEDATRPAMGFAGAWLQLGGQQIHLILSPSPLPAPAGGHTGRDRHLALEVADLDPLLRRLEAARVPCTSSRSGRRALFCRDPDGNGLEFVEVPAAGDRSAGRQGAEP